MIARAVLRLVFLTAVFCAPAALAWAQCDCEGGDGLFTTHSGIVIDGSRTDWNSVLSDPDNNACDGGLEPLPGPDRVIDPQPDRDEPVQSTGRDLIWFALTWDDASVQTLTGRVASSSNTQNFIYYADVDNDGLMETGERVIVAGWKGSNRTVNVYLGTYQASSPAGDPTADGSGFADGYTLPGQVVNLPSTGNPDYTGTWGTTDGLWMEWEVPWADAPGAPGLGLAPGTAFTFHVSSTNSTPGAGSFPAQVDDNMGGCGGGAGSTQYADLTYTPDRALTAAAGDTVYAAHTVVNLGNGTDTFDLAAAAPTGDHAPSASFLLDADGSGSYTPGDTPLTDTGGTGAVDTGPIAPGDSLRVLIRYTVAADAAGTAAIASVATSVFSTLAYGSVIDTVAVTAPPPSLWVTKTAATVADPVNGAAPDAKAIPGAWIDYTITVMNTGSGPADSGSVVLTDPVPSGTQLYVNDLSGAGSGPVAFTDGSPASGLVYTFVSVGSAGDGLAFSNDGGLTFSYVPVPGAAGFDPAVTHVRVSFSGALLGDSGSGAPQFSVRFRAGVE